MSDFYLMTRAAYAKLSQARRESRAASRLYPRQHHHPRHRRRGHRSADAVPDGAAVVGCGRGLVLRAGRHARRSDGPRTRRRHPVRGRARRDLRPDRRRRDILRAGVVGGGRHPQRVAGGRDTDLSGHVAGHLLHQGPRRGQRAGRRRRDHRATGAAGHRAERRRPVRPVRGAVVAARGDVGARGAPAWSPAAAAAHRAHVAGRDGAAWTKSGADTSGADNSGGEKPETSAP